jgi:Ca2+-binding EF-hand superfamily protein
LKRHCGEIALQKMHMHNKMSLGPQRKMNLHEFTILMNHAFSFLGVKVDDDGAKAIFMDADHDHDGIITYEEYFSSVQKHILKPEKNTYVPPPVVEVKEVNSRLRRFIWEQVRRIYNLYDKDKNQQLDIKELEAMIRDILKDYANADINFVLMNAYHISPNTTPYLIFDVFVRN